MLNILAGLSWCASRFVLVLLSFWVMYNSFYRYSLLVYLFHAYTCFANHALIQVQMHAMWSMIAFSKSIKRAPLAIWQEKSKWINLNPDPLGSGHECGLVVQTLSNCLIHFWHDTRFQTHFRVVPFKNSTRFFKNVFENQNFVLIYIFLLCFFFYCNSNSFHIEKF